MTYTNYTGPMISPRSGKAVANQFVLTELTGNSYFNSYGRMIALKASDGNTYLDEKYWDYSKTTAKYRNEFLGMTTKEVQAKIKAGEILLTNLNKVE